MWHLVGTVACLWHHGGLKVAVETPHRDCTGAPLTFVAENVPREVPKSLPAAGALPMWRLGKTLLWDPGERLYPDKTYI